ncbi:hypothetical protein PF008_g12127 [Phytophthora fragariae]|uniref:Reverse transcriptase RNase H-like domain-containing protein n=1 Tax=Phytophthora fragariae TaxID=53985 RepID=A0A6G0RQ76_9STRA|nr:hypothetical protein PF008_g12127 [Phytophthora fragariae]
MVQATELVFPDYTTHFDVHTDASGFQLGAVISQRGRPVAFWSKKCNDSQRKYPANQLELFSIVLVLREYRSMVLGQDVRIHTDHLNLTYSTFNNWQMMRWRSEVVEFGPTLLYVKGEENIVADALSRLSTDGAELEKDQLNEHTQHHLAAAAPTASAAVVPFRFDFRELGRVQQQDPSLNEHTVCKLSGVQLKVGPISKKIDCGAEDHAARCARSISR